MLLLNQQVCKFIDKVVGQIKYKKIRPYIALEIKDHIETLKEDYIEQGLPEEEAYEKAVLQMGEAEKIGKELHETHKPHVEWIIMTLFAALIGLGLYTVLRYYEGYRDSSIHIRKIIYLGMGTAAFFMAYFLDYQKLEKWSWAGYVSSNLVLLATLLLGFSINGATRWIRVGGFSFTGFSIAALCLLIAYAGLVTRIKTDKVIGIIKLIGLMIPPIMLTLAEPNLVKAAALGISLSAILILYICSKEFVGDRKNSLMLITGLFAMSITAAGVRITAKQYLMERFRGFLNPESAPLGSGYTYMVLKSLRENAKWLGDSGMTFLKQPILTGEFDHFMLTTIISKCGWIVGIILVIIIACIICKMFLSSLKIKELYGKILSFAISAFFAAQFIVNILMNFGYLPCTDCSLPFVSYTGADTIIDMMLMGLMLGIYRRKDLVVIKQLDSSRS